MLLPLVILGILSSRRMDRLPRTRRTQRVRQLPRSRLLEPAPPQKPPPQQATASNLRSPRSPCSSSPSASSSHSSSITRSPAPPAALALKVKPLYSLVDNKYWVDEIYGAFIVTPLLMFTRLILDWLVDTGLVNGSGALAGATTRGLSTVTRRVQSGNIRSYAGWLALGAAAVLVVMIFGRSLWVH